jgi:hypothetical protein
VRRDRQKHEYCTDASKILCIAVCAKIHIKKEQRRRRRRRKKKKKKQRFLYGITDKQQSNRELYHHPIFVISVIIIIIVVVDLSLCLRTKKSRRAVNVLLIRAHRSLDLHTNPYYQTRKICIHIIYNVVTNHRWTIGFCWWGYFM